VNHTLKPLCAKCGKLYANARAEIFGAAAVWDAAARGTPWRNGGGCFVLSHSLPESQKAGPSTALRFAQDDSRMVHPHICGGAEVGCSPFAGSVRVADDPGSTQILEPGVFMGTNRDDRR
jgi:hypothetical protein